jgi:hypothetical protein
MPPDFPTVADLIAQLYPQSGGSDLDGVLFLDPYAIAALMAYTGPVTVSGLDQPITAETAAAFIVHDQYFLAEGDARVSLVDAIGRTTIERLLSSALPSPVDIADTFRPLAAAGRLGVWSAHPDEQAALEQIGLADSFPQLAGGDGVAVTIDNAAANKIDQYLDIDAEYAVVDVTGEGERRATLTVTITNMAPAEGMPEYVIGNVIGKPPGYNRSLVSIYTALPVVGVTLDGQPSGLETDTVFGWNVGSQFIDIPSGATRRLVIELAGSLAAPGPPVIRSQPLVLPVTYTIAHMP